MIEILQHRMMLRILPETPEDLARMRAALRRERWERFKDIYLGAFILWLFMMVPVIGRLLK